MYVLHPNVFYTIYCHVFPFIHRNVYFLSRIWNTVSLFSDILNCSRGERREKIQRERESRKNQERVRYHFFLLFVSLIMCV